MQWVVLAMQEIQMGLLRAQIGKSKILRQ